MKAFRYRPAASSKEGQDARRTGAMRFSDVLGEATREEITAIGEAMEAVVAEGEKLRAEMQELRTKALQIIFIFILN